MTSSPTVNVDRGCTGSTGAWRAEEKDEKPWLQIDLGEACKLYGVAVHSGPDRGHVAAPVKKSQAPRATA